MIESDICHKKVLLAIKEGKSAAHEIAQYIGENPDSVNKYMDLLKQKKLIDGAKGFINRVGFGFTDSQLTPKGEELLSQLRQ